jgi:PTS system beta-glucosides-specific IIC component
LPGLFTLVNAISPDAPMSFIGELVGAGTAIVLTIVMVQFVGFEDPANEEEPTCSTGKSAGDAKYRCGQCR